MFSLFPKDDHNQSLRIKRFLMAFGSYVMWSTLAVFLHFQNQTRVTLNVLVISLTGILVVNILIYATIRTGLNKRFKDPSLTLLQMVIATFWAMVVVYYADSIRSVVLLLYLVVFVFGLFKLNVWQFLFLSAFAVVNYTSVIFLLYKIHPEAINARIEILNIVVLATVLPWFSLVGGYITRLRNKISHALSTIEKIAIIDDLTQVFNRRQMYKILEHEKALVDRGVNSFSVCIFDLDHFKRVNDTFGHSAGDVVLRTVAQEAQKNLRNIDHIARYGGEEFILILTHSEKREAMDCAERIRELTKQIVFDNMPSDFRITISVGVTEYQPSELIQKAIDRADVALYRAKANGRDRVEYEPMSKA
ncbi:MAG: GGDEF domain-containing protein [Deltaproteobacteria bacterium HGW-Deltaproteobacteria-2]|nr:MAG: GGDEF domain-containing protein [Deltaproteobacteria bacterium HGW-Deltaproteobacteria-2]